jgi:hypothetical protein
LKRGRELQGMAETQPGLFPAFFFDRQSQSLDFSELMRQNDAGVKYSQITLF